MTIKCPFCAEGIQHEAKICKHCGKSLTTEEAQSLFREEENKKKREEEEKLKKEKEEKERKHFEALSEKEKEEYLIKKERKNIVNALLIIIGVASFLLLLHFPYALPFTFLLAILLYSKQGEVFVENMIKNYKKHRIRVLLVLGGLVLLAVIAVSAYFIIEDIIIERKGIQAEEEARIEAEMIKNYPIPKIEIISSLEHQGDAEEYLLEFKASDTEQAFVNERIGTIFSSDEKVTEVFSEEEVYSYVVTLKEIENDIRIIAENKYKETSMEFVITRDETEEEREKEIYITLKYAIDAVFSDPELEYILDSDALLDKWERDKTAEVANKYGISVTELNEIYLRGVEREYGW